MVNEIITIKKEMHNRINMEPSRTIHFRNIYKKGAQSTSSRTNSWIWLIPGYWISAWVWPFFSNIAIFWTVPNAENTCKDRPVMWDYKSLTGLDIKQKNANSHRVEDINSNSILHIFNGSQKHIAVRFFPLPIRAYSSLNIICLLAHTKK